MVRVPYSTSTVVPICCSNRLNSLNVQDKTGQGGTGAEPAVCENIQAPDHPAAAQCAHHCGRLQRRRPAGRGKAGILMISFRGVNDTAKSVNCF